MKGKVSGMDGGVSEEGKEKERRRGMGWEVWLI
jgi:hypothetical protein